MSHARFIVGLMLLVLGLGSQTHGGDWPQILGSQRNGVAVGEKLAASWPASGPTTLWRAAVGSGYAGPAVADGKVVVFDRLGDQERLLAFDLRDGKPLWTTEFEATYGGGIDPDLGPRCVPTIHQGLVYAFGAAGDLHCVELASGKKRWSRSLAADYGAPDGYFGAGSSPVVAGERLWVNVGGRTGGLVALALDTGKTLYAGTKELASYSSPTLVKIKGVERVVFVTRYNALAIDPVSGEPVFSFAFGMRGPTVNAATPLVFNDRLFVSASYGIGAKLADVTGAEPKIVWENDSSMSSQYTTCVYRDGYLYGIDGREDQGVARLRCIEAATGDVAWTEEGFGIAHLILAGDKLLIVRHDGQVQLVLATPKAYSPLASAQVVKGSVRALPALSDGRLLIRTIASAGKGEVVCVGVGAK